MKALAAVGLSLLACCAFAQYPGAKRVPNEWRTGFNSIKEENAKAILTYLAGPELRGRGSLSPDYFAAAGWVAGQLRVMGLKPMGDNGSYFQRFDFVRATVVPDSTSLNFSDVAIPYGPNFQTSWIGDLEAKVKFAFMNVPANADLSNFNWESLRGRCLVYTSGSLRNAAFSAKLVNARETLGVEQTILATAEQLSTNNPLRASGVRDTPDPRNGTIGQLRFSRTGIRMLADRIGAQKFLIPEPTELSVELPDQELTLKVKTTQEFTPLVNVVAMLPGSDPNMAKEAVFFGSHLDHVGPANDGIRYGADDNASGCTANLMLAKAMLENPIKPKRSVVFAFWAAEEIGLYGSYAFVSRPTFPLTNIAAYFNMDMLGRNEEFGPEIADFNTEMVYPGIVINNSVDFYNRLVAANEYVKLRLKPDKTDRTFRSDTGNFVWKSVPTVKVFTGEHPDYHRAGDTIDKINWTKLINITKWLYLAASDLATRPDRPKFERTPFVVNEYVLAGRATFTDSPPLPVGAKIEVTLQDVTDATPKDLLTRSLPATASPIPFELIVPKSQLVAGRKYALSIKVIAGKDQWFRNESGLDVPITGWSRAQTVKLASTRP